MPLITNLGSGPFGIAICLFLLTLGITTKNKPLQKLVIIGIVAILITSIIVSLLKISVAEPRPFITLKNIHLLVIEKDPYSFPSGHTANAFALATAFGLNWKIHIFKKNVRLIWLLIPVAAIIGFSRIYIGVHYPVDVLVGGIIGITTGLIATKIGNIYLKNYNKN